MWPVRVGRAGAQRENNPISGGRVCLLTAAVAVTGGGSKRARRSPRHPAAISRPADPLSIGKAPFESGVTFPPGSRAGWRVLGTEKSFLSRRPLPSHTHTHTHTQNRARLPRAPPGPGRAPQQRASITPPQGSFAGRGGPRPAARGRERARKQRRGLGRAVAARRPAAERAFRRPAAAPTLASRTGGQMRVCGVRCGARGVVGAAVGRRGRGRPVFGALAAATRGGGGGRRARAGQCDAYTPGCRRERCSTPQSAVAGHRGHSRGRVAACGDHAGAGATARPVLIVGGSHKRFRHDRSGTLHDGAMKIA